MTQADPAENPNRLTIAALTCRRPQGLSDLLKGLDRIAVPDDMTAHVIIVDNCPEGSAQPAVARAARDFSLSLSYFNEPQPGISAARNRALEIALDSGADYLACIDDDEVPSESWLTKHLETLSATGADASLGPVEPRYQTRPPLWILRGAFHRIGGMPRHKTLDFGNTSNVVFSLAPVREHHLRFHLEFSLTGGEDTDFFHRYIKTGARIVYAPDATVTETVGPDRSKLRWLTRRWRRTGGTSATVIIRDQPVGLAKTATLARCMASGAARIVLGTLGTLVTLPAAALGRYDVPAKCLRIVMRGVGFFDAVRGCVVEEYRRPTS